MANMVVVAHENPLLRIGLSYIIEQTQSYKVKSCATAEQALSLCKENKVSVLLTSFSIPNMEALELISRLNVYSGHTNILVCAAESSGLIAEKCIQSGAHGYITSKISSAELIHALTMVDRGKFYTEASVSQKLAMKKIKGKQHAFDTLSPREFDIFSKVIMDKTVKEVAKDLFLAEKTVANYVSIIKKKLNAKTGVGLLRAGIREGFVEINQD